MSIGKHSTVATASQAHLIFCLFTILHFWCALAHRREPIQQLHFYHHHTGRCLIEAAYTSNERVCRELLEHGIENVHQLAKVSSLRQHLKCLLPFMLFGFEGW
jgi:hypothetical protein